MPAIMTDTPNLLTTLQSHARAQGDLRCHLLPDRVITYRRFWARIERASARLQGEWGIDEGDTVAYIGQGHPDALVLYFALLRIGASLLPLEYPMPEYAQVVADNVTMRQPALVLYDRVRPAIDLPSSPLHALLALWCTHDPHPLFDDVRSPKLWLPGSAGWGEFSLDELTVAMDDRPSADLVGLSIFTQASLCRIVLPSLRLGLPMRFAVFT